MKHFARVAAAAATVTMLTACSHGATTPARSTTSPTPTPLAAGTVTQSASPADCRQQYLTWKDGPGQTMVAAVNDLGTAVTAKDVSAVTADLKKAGPAAVTVARHPLPTCADPKGYWMTLMMHVNAAASTASKSGANALSALQIVPAVNSQLTAELKRTTG